MTHNPFLFPALIGNGRLLVCLDEHGGGRRFFWPEIDYGQHLTRYRLALQVEGGPPLWLDDPAWQSQQEYVATSNVLRTVLRHPEGWEVDLTDSAVPAPVTGDEAPDGPPPGDAWVRRLTVRSPRSAALGLVWAVAMRIDEHPLAQTVFFDPGSEAAYFYRRDTFVAMAADMACDAFATGTPEGVWDEVGHGHFNLRPIQMGDSAAALRLPLGPVAAGAETAVSLLLAAGASHQATLALLAYWRPRSALAGPAAAQSWATWLAGELAGQDAGQAGSPVAAAAVVYQRSLLLLPLVQSAAGGGVIAAPEFDSAFRQCGGYGFSWGRDAAFVALAMDRAGLHRLARKAYLWAARTQNPEGWWMQRHYTSGAWAPSWGLMQVDETGILLLGMVEHCRLTRDEGFRQQVWPCLVRGADFLSHFAHASTGLPGPTVDLWEERTGDFAYAAAACWAGLAAVAALGSELGQPEAALWSERAAALQETLLRELYSDEHGRFLRARALEIYPDLARQMIAEGRELPVEEGPKGSRRYLQEADAAVDASLLGLSVPCAVLPPEDPRLAATVDAVARELQAPDGGIRRYQGDQYRGGNPWVLCTLWLGLCRARAGRWAEAQQALQYATRAASPLGYLPEQVEAATGQPAWVLPLTWSHALYILLYRELAAAGKLP